MWFEQIASHCDNSAQLFRKQKKGELLNDWNIPAEQGYALARAWCYFFTREYWSRTWIVQEVILAKSILLHCGNSELSWEDITKLFAGTNTSELLKHYLKWSDPEASKDFHVAVNRIRTLVERRSQEHDLRRLFPDRYAFTDIFNLIIACKDTKCSDKRDKVYALLSLCEANTGIEPDYRISTEEVFHSVFVRETRLSYDEFNEVAAALGLYNLQGCHKIVSCLFTDGHLSPGLTVRLVSWVLRSFHRLLCVEQYGSAGLDRFHPREAAILAMPSEKDVLEAEAFRLKQEIESFIS